MLRALVAPVTAVLTGLALLGAATGCAPAPDEPGLVRAFPDGSYSVGGQPVAADALISALRAGSGPVLVHTGAGVESSRFWTVIQCASLADRLNVAARFTEGGEVTLPMRTGCLCRAIDFVEGDAQFGAHDREWNYVIVDIQVSGDGRALVTAVTHDDRRGEPYDGPTALPPGWEQGAPPIGAAPDALGIRAYFDSLPAGEVEPLVRLDRAVDAPLSATFDLLHQLRTAVGMRVLLGAPDEPVLEDEDER